MSQDSGSSSARRRAVLIGSASLALALVASVLIWQWPQRMLAATGWNCGDGVTLILAEDALGVHLPWERHADEGHPLPSLTADERYPDWSAETIEQWETILDATGIATAPESSRSITMVPPIGAAGDGIVVDFDRDATTQLVGLSSADLTQEWLLDFATGSFDGGEILEGGSWTVGASYSVESGHLVIRTLTSPTGHRTYTDTMAFDLGSGERAFCTRTQGGALPSSMRWSPDQERMGDVMVTLTLEDRESGRLEALELTDGEVLWDKPWDSEDAEVSAGLSDLWVTSALTPADSITGDRSWQIDRLRERVTGGEEVTQIVAHAGADGSEVWRYPGPGDEADLAALLGTFPDAFGGEGGVLVADLGEQVPPGETRTSNPEAEFSVTMLTRDGDVAWTAPALPTQSTADTLVTTADDGILVYLDEDELVRLDADTGQVAARFDISDFGGLVPLQSAHPVGDGWALFGHNHGAMFDRQSGELLREGVADRGRIQSAFGVGGDYVVIEWLHGHSLFALH